MFLTSVEIETERSLSVSDGSEILRSEMVKVVYDSPCLPHPQHLHES